LREQRAFRQVIFPHYAAIRQLFCPKQSRLPTASGAMQPPRPLAWLIDLTSMRIRPICYEISRRLPPLVAHGAALAVAVDGSSGVDGVNLAALLCRRKTPRADRPDLSRSFHPLARLSWQISS
jgi:pilus assembly protein Flp/PilA